MIAVTIFLLVPNLFLSFNIKKEPSNNNDTDKIWFFRIINANAHLLEFYRFIKNII